MANFFSRKDAPRIGGSLRDPGEVKNRLYGASVRTHVLPALKVLSEASNEALKGWPFLAQNTYRNDIEVLDTLSPQVYTPLGTKRILLRREYNSSHQLQKVIVGIGQLEGAVAPNRDYNILFSDDSPVITISGDESTRRNVSGLKVEMTNLDGERVPITGNIYPKPFNESELSVVLAGILKIAMNGKVPDLVEIAMLLSPLDPNSSEISLILDRHTMLLEEAQRRVDEREIQIRNELGIAA